MENYQKMLAAKIKKIIPGLVLHELLAGLSISISYNVMRYWSWLLLLFPARMLLASDKISLITFLIFLFVAVRIYEPLTKACEMLGEMIYSLVSAKRIRDLLDGPEQQGQEDIQIGQYDITFDHVSFVIIRKMSFTMFLFTANAGGKSRHL